MSTLAPPLVLLVDDEPQSLKLLSDALLGQPFAIAVATDGEMALSQIRREPPDLVLLDVVMPGMDGFEVCRRLQANPATRDIPIIFMTSLTDAASLGIELGAVDYVTKPFVRAELTARVRAQLALRAKARMLAEKNAELERTAAELACARDSLEAEVRRRTDELMASNQRLAHLDRVAAMAELATSIAHELNQPLAAILNNAQAARRLLHKSPPDVAEAIAALGDIANDGRRAGSIIQRMRRMLKKGAPSADAQDLNALAGEVARLVGNDALLRGAQLRLELEPRLPCVRGDAVQLQQVLLNLVVNALDAVAERPAGARLVVVKTHCERTDQVVLSVEDSGKGIAPADMERVFEAFYTTKPEGLGVGLAISRSIVEAHGGRLWAESSPVGGAMLQCTLPAWIEDGSATTNRASSRE
ncbi:response regulator [Nannocystis sp. ILAH1]|uniref:hybrid sensor histidine kinase/response regulator n=1 Tax=unclassified Nannocystis TaxID=2627009 RepID=UPI0022721E46|nr:MULTISPECIES: response regulator [unclassified Nannocystis]MCY0992119.1 response regulator [Nannocystis sp. ILAH1]MCY1064368.1 response regulator [Nannocystis sp. RBIL2]